MKICVLGAGTWGIALARMLANIGHQVAVWSAIPAEIVALKQTHLHPNLPGAVIPDTIDFAEDLETACAGSQIVLFAVPSVFVRSTARKARPFITDQVIVDVAKGIEPNTLLTMSQIIQEEIPGKPVVALSGPTHAEEVSRDIPTTIISASEDAKAAEFVQDTFMNSCMRVYTSTDVIGVELCGALKNVIALAAGISDGLGYGDNTKAALITRGIAEMTRLGTTIGCSLQTFAGLAGIGDLIVTATSVHSRNHRCGEMIGQGVPPQEAVKRVGMVVEGINALPSALQLAAKYQVDMPIVNMVDAVVNRGMDPKKSAYELMMREKKIFE